MQSGPDGWDVEVDVGLEFADSNFGMQ